MRTRTLIVLLIGLAALSAAALALVRAQQGPPAVASRAIGSWTEIGTTPPRHMTIAKTGPDHYAVRYPAGAGAAPWVATLVGDHIQVWGENAISDPRYQIRYDDARDQLIVERNGATIRLERTP